MNGPTDYGVQVMKVPRAVFLSLIWTGAALAIICCSLRFLVRFRAFKKLLVDDYFVLLALCFVLANAIIWQIYAKQMYYIMTIPGVEVPDEDFLQAVESYFKATVAVIILFYSALWSIKLSFLLFFRRLGTNVRGQRLIWWPIFAFTLATYFACIGTIQYQCLVSSVEYIAANCQTSAATSFQKITLRLNCAWDVTTDCLITLIPFSMLKGVQMRWRRKVALGGIFSLAVITMIFAIVRTALVGSDKRKPIDSSWLYMWSAIEASIAIIVACLATFRNLFSRESNHRKIERPVIHPASSNLFLRGNGKRGKIPDILDSLAAMPDHSYSEYRQENASTNDAGLTINYHSHGAHDLNELSRTL